MSQKHPEAVSGLPTPAERIALLEECGAGLYGPLNWKAPLSRDLGVEDRTLKRWAAGDSPVPAGVMADLLRLTQQRALELDALADRLRIAATPA